MTEKTKQHLRRYVVFAMGMIIDSIGIAFITRAGLGTSPISGIPFVLSLILPPSIGTFTFLFNYPIPVWTVLFIFCSLSCDWMRNCSIWNIT